MRPVTCLSTMLVMLLAVHGAEAVHVVGSARAGPRWDPGFQAFELREGREAAVCQAYVEMLRSIEFEDPPYCSRSPELDHRRLGFEPLGWKKLESRTELELRLVVPQYFRSGRLDDLQKVWSQEEHMRAINPEARSYLYQDIEAATARERFHKLAEAAVAQNQRTPVSVDTAYELAAAVDIDNDGVADRVAIWPDEGSRCGAVHDEEPLIFGRHAVVLQAAGGFDAKKTDEIFRHPDNYRVLLRDPASGQTLPYPMPNPRYLVRAITITKYRGSYLFDGLMTTELTDSSKARREKNEFIGVFEHRQGITTMRCKIVWRGPAPR